MKTYLMLMLILVCQLSYSQKIHKISLELDGSYGLHYFSTDQYNPISYSASLGYQFDLNYFLALEIGLRGGGFYQDMNHPTKNEARKIYKGTSMGGYLAPKLYIPVGFSDKYARAHYFYISNKFSYLHNKLSKSKLEEIEGSDKKNRFNYEIQFGYQHALNTRLAINTWIGYNSYDFSRINKHFIKGENNTKLQFGIGFSYIINKGER